MAIITISRGTFVDGKSTAECVARQLGYRCISREMLLDAAEDYGISLDKLSEALSKPPGILHNSDRERMKYLSYIRIELLKAVKDENVVYHGLAGNLLLHDAPNLLGIRLVASIEHRIKAAMERTNLLRTDIIDFIRNRDKQRDKWVKYVFNVDRNDPSLYDLVIDLDQTDIEGACETICAKASRKEYRKTPESQKRLNDLVLAADVKARIAGDSYMSNGHIQVDAREGVILLKGKATFIKDADRARIVARETPGVKDIDSRIRVGTITQAIGQF